MDVCRCRASNHAARGRRAAAHTLRRVWLHAHPWDEWLAKRKEEYYQQGASHVSDDAYDAVERRRRRRRNDGDGDGEEEERVGAPVRGGTRSKRAHVPSMLSLQATRTKQELMEWRKKMAVATTTTTTTTTCGWMVEPKVDGVALRLTYVDGRLVEAATRGDGRRGEDVTRSVQRRMDVPKHLSTWDERDECHRVVDVRGEAFLTKRDLECINETRARMQRPPFAHARNAIAGALRRLEETNTTCEEDRHDAHVPVDEYADAQGQAQVRFSAYALYENGAPAASTQRDTLQQLRDMGFYVSPGVVHCDTFEQAVRAAEDWMEKRNAVPFDVDGVVIKLNDLEEAAKLGNTTTAPRGSVAWKFPARETVTTLLDVRFTVGRTGRVVPNAVLEPVELAGARIGHATLHNFNKLKELDVRRGDQVVVKRAGDVIPQVVLVLHDLRTGEETEVVAPASCPSCGEKLVQLEGEELHRCINHQCLAQQQRRLEHFVGTCVDGVGKGVIQDLLREGLVEDIADLYKLEAQQLEALPGYGPRSVSLIMSALRDSKNPELHLFLTALGIRFVGGQVSRLLASHFCTLEALQQASIAELSMVHGVGCTTAESLWEWFRRPANSSLLEKLEAVGFLPCRLIERDTAAEQQEKSTLHGLSVVLTGTLQSLTREQAREMIEQRGGIVKSSVSRGTDLVVTGRKPGSKLENAKELDIQVLSEEEFLELLQER